MQSQIHTKCHSLFVVSNVQTCEGLMGIHCVIKLQIRHVVHAALGLKAP